MIDITATEIRLGDRDGRVTVFDPVRRKWLLLTPEEHVRQYVLQYLVTVAGYPLSLLAVEKTIKVGNRNKRFDVVVYDRDHKPWMLVECKAPDVPISEQTLLQLIAYQQTMQCRYWLLTNGHQTYCADACNPASIQWLDLLPVYDT